MSYRRIKANISELLDGAPTLVLDADATAGDSSVTVKSIVGAAANNIILFRLPGDELAEIGSISGAPSGNTVTLAAVLTESHPAGTTIYIIKADQIRFYRAATAVDANSDDSTLTALAALQDIDPTEIYNIYDDSASTSGYYYYRFYDSVGAAYLDYSDPIPWTDAGGKFDPDQVGYMLDSVCRTLEHTWNDQFSKQDAIDEIGKCLRYAQGKLRHWNRYLVSDYNLGQTSRGSFEFDMPSDIYDDQSNKSVLSIRLVGADNPLIWRDEKEFDQIMAGAKHSPLRTATTAGDTTLDIDNSYDFDDDGTLHIYTSGTLDEITYTAVTRSSTAGQFTGVPASGDGAIAVTHAVDTEVWQDEVEGQPKYWTVKNGKICIWPLPDDSWENKNIQIDYNTAVTSVDSESDSIDADRYDMVEYWLLWKGKARWKNNGKIDVKDDDFLMFQDILKTAIKTTVSGQKYKMRPNINTVSYRPQKRQGFIYD